MAYPQTVNPSSGKPGEHLTVVVKGDEMIPCDGVSFGKGVVVADFRNGPVDTIEVDIEIRADAIVGRRFVTVDAMGTAGHLPGGFFDIR